MKNKQTNKGSFSTAKLQANRRGFLARLLVRIALVAAIGFSTAGCPGDPAPKDPPSIPQPFNDITAAQLVGKIKIGWNLGNTLDAHNNGYEASTPVSTLETMWSNPVTTEAMITAVKNAGFNGIRIPVSWHKAADSNYNIRADWMARVVEVVDYAVDNDMYILLNTHHDEGIFKFTNAEKTESLKAYKKIWGQIADTFKNYDEKLIFEGLNEPRTIGAAYEWNGGNAEERANLNEHYRVFVETVRASGGNNGKRILMVNTYAASAEQSALNGLTIPTDSANAKNRIIVSIHAYAPFYFAHEYDTPDAVNTWSKNNPSDVAGVNRAIDNAYNTFVSNGYPVIIGEFGSRSEKDEASRAEWAEYYVSYARSKGIPCFLWDDGGWFKFFNRSAGTFYAPSVLAALMNGVKGPLPAVIEPPSGGGVAPIIGQWVWGTYDDRSNGGGFSISITQNTDEVAISGNVVVTQYEGYSDGYAGCYATPDEDTLTSLKSAASISFKVNGDGKTYRVILPTNDITDYCYYYTTFSTAQGVEKTVTVNVPGDLVQPAWGQQKAFKKSAVENIQWQTADGASGAFTVTIKSLRLNP